MKNEKDILFEQIKEYSIIVDDYINRRYKYTMNTEYLEEEVKAISGALLETIEDYENLLLEEETK